MKTVNAHLATYAEMVAALQREYNKDMSCPIDWGEITRGNRSYEIGSVKVMQTPQYLEDVGFGPEIVYSKEHFLSTMKEAYDQGGVRHGYSQTQHDLLDLPQMLMRPVAILTDDDRGIDGEKTEYATILAYGQDEQGSPVFRKIIASPSDKFVDLGGIKDGACILTYLNINQSEFVGNLERANSGHRQVLYFDANQFSKIPDEIRPKQFDQWQSFCGDNVYNHLSTPSRDRLAKIARTGRNIADIAYVELERYAENIRYVQDGQNIRHEPLKKAIECIESNEAPLQELLQARGVFMDVCQSIRSPSLQEAAIKRMEPHFALTYLNAIDEIDVQKLADGFAAHWEQDGMIRNEQDVENMWKNINDICNSVNVEFHPAALSEHGYVQEAQEACKNLMGALNDALADKAFEIEDMIAERDEIEIAD